MFKKLASNLKEQLYKVNVQVALFSCVLIGISCALIFLIMRASFMQVIETTYRAKTDIIFNMIEPHLDSDVYSNFSDEWSIQTESYNSVRNYLEMVKENYAVDTIFLTRLDEQGNPVYIMDVEKTYEKFNAPGAEVSGAIANEVKRSFTAGHSKVGSFYNINNVWEYMRTYQIKGEKSNTEAVVCIGINAQTLFNRTYIIMALAIILVIACMILAIVFAGKAFKKISNPFYQDVSNTDSLTSLKNKNSFTIDFHNIENQGHQEKYSVIAVDLNGLKTINDTRGHHIGDKYIQDSAAILKKSTFSRNHVVYRIGGDEFVIIMYDATYADIDKLMKNIKENTKKANEVGGSIKISMSVGYAMFEKSMDRNFSNTLQRADTMMYNVKREYYRKKIDKQKKNEDTDDDV